METMLTFEGGFGTRRFPVKSVDIDTTGYGRVTFVHCQKNAEWILQGSVGTAEKATLKRSQLFKTLKEKLMAAVAADSEDTVAVAAGSGAAAEEQADDDPMNQLRDIATPEKNKRKRKRTPYKSKLGKNCPRMLTMPAKEPNKHPHNMATRDVLVMPHSTNALYIRDEDIPWMICWLADECGPGGSQGVPVFDDDADEPNCSIDGIYIEWDHTAAVATLTAKGVSGPLEGRVFNLSLANFTETKWDVVNEIHGYGVTFSEANAEQIKAAAWNYIEWYCSQQLSA